MPVQFIVEFKNNPPTPDTILQKLRENTGLYVTMNETQEAFIHPMDEKQIIPFYKEDRRIVVPMVTRKIPYFLGAVLNTLLDLGGTCNRSIPKWTRKEWQGKTQYRLLWK
jgi:hypothetical protein